jgi:hypothetical protein
MNHVHDHRVHVGNAPVTMMAGMTLGVRRACPCGDVITTGTYVYDPED